MKKRVESKANVNQSLFIERLNFFLRLNFYYLKLADENSTGPLQFYTWNKTISRDVYIG